MFWFRKRGLLEKGLLREVNFLDILENLEILEILENPQTVENKGESDYFLEILESSKILKILETPFPVPSVLYWMLFQCKKTPSQTYTSKSAMADLIYLGTNGTLHPAAVWKIFTRSPSRLRFLFSLFFLAFSIRLLPCVFPCFFLLASPCISVFLSVLFSCFSVLFNFPLSSDYPPLKNIAF